MEERASYREPLESADKWYMRQPLARLQACCGIYCGIYCGSLLGPLNLRNSRYLQGYRYSRLLLVGSNLKRDLGVSLANTFEKGVWALPA